MELWRLEHIFNGEDNFLTECLSHVAETGKGLKARNTLNAHIKSLQSSGSKEWGEIDDAIGDLLSAFRGAYLTAGYVIGQAFDVHESSVLREIRFMEKKLKYALDYWAREKKAPERSGDEDPGASKQE